MVGAAGCWCFCLWACSYNHRDDTTTAGWFGIMHGGDRYTDETLMWHVVPAQHWFGRVCMACLLHVLRVLCWLLMVCVVCDAGGAADAFQPRHGAAR